MRTPIALSLAAIVLSVATQFVSAQAQQADSDAPSLRVTSTLVFLDVTVLDKNGKPVTNGLGQDDFTISEDGKPQRIFSFEAPQAHVMPADSKDEDPDGHAPRPPLCSIG